MHLALAILVGLAQVAGPWLGSCCCRPATPAVAVVTPVEPAACPHCPCQPIPTPAEPPTKPCPHGPQPCFLKVLTVADVPVRPAVEWDRLLAVESAVPVLLTPVVPAAASLNLCAWNAGRSELPFLPTSVRLYTHHALRC